MIPPLRRLWFGVVAAPSAWVLCEVAGYPLGATGCAAGGAGHPAFRVIVISAAMFGLGLAGLLVAIDNLRHTGAEASTTPASATSRARFMAAGGTGLSALFLFGIVLFGIPPLLTNPCTAIR